MVFLQSIFCFGQNNTQTMRGTVSDKVSKERLIGASIQLLETGKGAGADTLGVFKIENITPGRYTLKVGVQPNLRKTSQMNAVII